MKTDLQLISDYLTSTINWGFVFNFISMGFVISTDFVQKLLAKVLPFKIKTRHQMLVTGVSYLLFVFFKEGAKTETLSVLIQSLLFAFVFHKMLVEQIAGFVMKQLSDFTDQKG